MADLLEQLTNLSKVTGTKIEVADNETDLYDFFKSIYDKGLISDEVFAEICNIFEQN